MLPRATYGSQDHLFNNQPITVGVIFQCYLFLFAAQKDVKSPNTSSASTYLKGGNRSKVGDLEDNNSFFYQ